MFRHLSWGGKADEPHRRATEDHGRRSAHHPEAQGIVVRCPSNRGLAEEAPFAYEDDERIVAVFERAGLAGRWPGRCRAALSRDHGCFRNPPRSRLGCSAT